jgi:predicted DNA-binding protein (UPF0251 family)
MKGFKPFGIAKRQKSIPTISMLHEEYEAFRLMDYMNLSQEEAARIMRVSRSTITRIYEEARIKIAKALVECSAIVIEGGDIVVEGSWFQCQSCFQLTKELGDKTCPVCLSGMLKPIRNNEDIFSGYDEVGETICLHCDKPISVENCRDDCPHKNQEPRPDS